MCVCFGPCDRFYDGGPFNCRVTENTRKRRRVLRGKEREGEGEKEGGRGSDGMAFGSLVWSFVLLLDDIERQRCVCAVREGGWERDRGRERERGERLTQA